MNTNALMRENFQLRAAAREQLAGKWTNCVIVSIIYAVLMSLTGIPAIGFIIAILIQGPLSYGVKFFYIKFVRGEEQLIERMFEGFKSYTPALAMWFLTSVFTFLWSLLLVIPGIFAAISYSQVYYIMIDNPGIGTMEAINKSKKMMYGYKGKFFLLCLSFIGWAILCIFTFGIGYLWLYPYVETTMANFYQDLKGAGNAEA